MNGDCFLGIDAGTSGVKAVVIDIHGHIRGMGYRECDVINPHPGWAEQNPEDWWIACDGAVQEAVQKSGCGSAVAGIGLSGQMQGCVLLDRQGEPIGNCIIWLDQRADEETEAINQLGSVKEMLNVGGYCLNSFWAPKLLWIRKHRPADFEKIETVMFTKDYLRYRMTGEIATDVSDASLTFFVDLPKRRWSDKMIDKIGIPRDILPERLLESTEPAGRLRADLAARWGIRAGTIVAAGAGDQPACGVGSDVARSGVIGSSIGTSGAVFGCIDHPFVIEKSCAAYSMCHAVPDEWCFLGLSLTSGASFKWLRDIVFAEKKAEMALKKGNIYGYMTGLAQKADPGCEGLLFLPYLNGDKTPNNDKAARGVWFGLSQRHGVNELCRSVMEGVTFSLRDSLELLREQGMEVQEVHASGGGAKSSLWRQIQADIFHAPVMTMNVEESPAAGAAIIAGVAAGVFRNIQEGCDCMIRVTDVTEPIESHAKIYDDYFQEYRQLYASLKKNFMDQNRIVQKYSV